jgi:hypothetical protein
MVISTPDPRLTRHDLVKKVTAEYTVLPKDNIALEQLHFPGFNGTFKCSSRN